MRIGTLHEAKVLVVHHVFRPDDTLQTLEVGSLLPAHATALGKVLLADHPYVAAALGANGLEAYTDATITVRPGSTESWSASGHRAGRRISGSWFRSGLIRRADRRSPRDDRRRDGNLRATERLLAARQPRGDLLGYVREGARAVSRELGAIPW